MFACTAGITGAMMSIDLPELTPTPRGKVNAGPRRPIPGAGLFGWRKDQTSPDAEDRTEKPSGINYLAD